MHHSLPLLYFLSSFFPHPNPELYFPPPGSLPWLKYSHLASSQPHSYPLTIFQLPYGPGLVLVPTLPISHLTLHQVCSNGSLALESMLLTIMLWKKPTFNGSSFSVPSTVDLSSGKFAIIQISALLLSSFLSLASHFISLAVCFPHPLEWGQVCGDWSIVKGYLVNVGLLCLTLSPHPILQGLTLYQRELFTRPGK